MAFIIHLRYFINVILLRKLKEELPTVCLVLFLEIRADMCKTHEILNNYSNIIVFLIINNTFFAF